MIRHPTVFVVGAGASVPFDFPTGLRLLADAKRDTPQNLRIEMQGWPTERVVTDFHNAIRDCQNESVDALLEHRRDLQDIGKRLIAAKLLRQEDASRGVAKNGGDWFQYLFSRMSENAGTVNEFLGNPVTFITYNYDRLIEYKLISGVRARYKASDEQCEEIARNPRVIHLHGSLGSLALGDALVPFGARGGDPVLDLNTEIAGCLERASRAIRIVHEPNPTDVAFRNARDALRTAERVFFLGFGFGVTNVDRLDFGHINAAAEIFYTRLGMTNQEVALYINEPNARSGLGHIYPGALDWDCLQLISEYVGRLVARYE